MLSNLMMSLRNIDEINEDLLRHMILNTIRMNRKKFSDKYGELVIACDDRNYWRKGIFPYYKASRKKTRDQSSIDWNTVFTSLNKIRDELKEYFPYPVIQIESAEADDVIGTLCHRFGRLLGGEPILILSADKDFVQLQTYSNVDQYDPTRKKWVKHPNPEVYITEHIIRGDSGDGIPNILSSDDTFVQSDKRQTPVRKTKIDHWVSCIDSGQALTDIFNTEELRNWNRNKSLISLWEIPERISDDVNHSYDEQQNKPRSKLFNYFIKHKLKNLTESIGDF